MTTTQTDESKSAIAWYELSLLLLLVCGSLLTLGCAAQSNDDPLTTDEQTERAESKLDIAAIALEEVERRTGIPRAQLITDVEREDYGWSVLIIPKQDTPGGFCTVTIDQNGAVTGFYGGA